MKINKVSTKQFAGLKDKEIQFSDNMNVIVGENETGKTTIVELLRGLMFQDSRITGAREFKNNFTPNKKLDAKKAKSSAMQGILVFSNEDGEYRLEKKWGAKENVELDTPDGYYTSDAEVKEVLENIFHHSKGLYDHVIFSSQRFEQRLLPNILGEVKAKDDITADLSSVLTTSMAEVDGLSINKLGACIKEKIATYNAYFDIEKDLPQGGKDKHKSKADSKDADKKYILLKAYYDIKNTNDAILKQDEAEKEVERLTEIHDKNNRKVDESYEKIQDFNKYSAQLSSISSNKRLIEKEQIKLNELNQVEKDWPKKQEQYIQLVQLNKDLVNAKIIEQYKDIEPSLNKAKSLEAYKDIQLDNNTITNYEEYERNIVTLQNKLKGSDMILKFALNTDITIVDSITKEIISINDNEALINTPITISIPNVGTIDLCAKDVDVEAIAKQIHDTQVRIQEINDQYNVESAKELRELYNIIVEYNSSMVRIDSLLAGKSLEQLIKEYEQIKNLSLDKNTVNKQITNIIGTKNIDSEIGALSSKLKEYNGKYIDLVHLKDLINECESEINKLEEKCNLDSIPEIYRNIENPDEYNEKLNDDYEAAKKDRDKSNNDLIDASTKNNFEESIEELTIKLEEFKRIYAIKKEEYFKLVEIQKAFETTKEELESNPIEGIAESFKKYLAIISDNQIELQGIDDHFTSEMTSSNNVLTHNNLSEGTKDTISLAFRLAMLEKIFPDGNGFAVFDDPFTDMDERRTKQACDLIKEFAKNNQVIFLTCDNKYTSMLGGKNIQFTK